MRFLIALLLALPLLGQLIIPSRARLLYPATSTSSTLYTCTLNTTDDQAHLMFRVPLNGAALTSVRFSLGTVTAAADLTIQVEGVSAVGLPSGTVAWAGAYAVLASASVTAGVHDVDLVAPGAVSADGMLAVTIVTAIDGNLVVNIGGATTGIPGGIGHYGGCQTDGGTEARSNVARGLWAVKIDGVWWPLSPLGAQGEPATQSIGAYYYGNRIVACDYTARVVGVAVQAYILPANNVLNAVIYSGNTTIATSYNREAAYSAQVTGYLYLPFAAPVILQRGVSYDVMIYRSSGSGTTSIYGYTAGAAADIGLMEYGTNIYGVTCLGTCGTASNRTALTTRRFNVHLVLDAMYAGSGGFVVTQ